MSKIDNNEKCWCGSTDIDVCKIHGSQPFYHDEGDGWNIYRCGRCEEIENSFAWKSSDPKYNHEPFKNYFETMHLRAMIVLADVLIKERTPFQ
jgi:hypothetical protein